MQTIVEIMRGEKINSENSDRGIKVNPLPSDALSSKVSSKAEDIKEKMRHSRRSLREN